MQGTGSAVLKMKYLLDAVAAIHESCSISGADDLVPLFVYIMARSELTMPEVEVTYIMELIDQSVLSGEGGYYLTTFAAATSVIRFWEFSDENIARAEQEFAPTYATVAPMLPPLPQATAAALSSKADRPVSAAIYTPLTPSVDATAPVSKPLEPDRNYSVGAAGLNADLAAPVYAPLGDAAAGCDGVGINSGAYNSWQPILQRTMPYSGAPLSGGQPVYAPIGTAATANLNAGDTGTMRSTSSGASYAEILPDGHEI